MAADDMNVIMYKILKYIYKCMKKGYQFDEDEISYEAFGIPQSYWAQIVASLVNSGYVDGVNVVYDMNRTPIIIMDSPIITIKGVEYITENSFMKKTLGYIKEAKQSIPGI